MQWQYTRTEEPVHEWLSELICGVALHRCETSLQLPECACRCAGYRCRDVILSEGDIKIYKPAVTDSAVTVPVASTNQGRKKAFYDVKLRVTGSGGFDAELRVTIKGAGLTP